MVFKLGTGGQLRLMYPSIQESQGNGNMYVCSMVWIYNISYLMDSPLRSRPEWSPNETCPGSP